MRQQVLFWAFRVGEMQPEWLRLVADAIGNFPTSPPLTERGAYGAGTNRRRADGMTTYEQLEWHLRAREYVQRLAHDLERVQGP